MKRRIALLLVICLLASMVPAATAGGAVDDDIPGNGIEIVDVDEQDLAGPLESDGIELDSDGLPDEIGDILPGGDRPELELGASLDLTDGDVLLSESEAQADAPETNDDSSDFYIKNGVLTDYNGTGGDVVIPDGVTSIGPYAFMQNDSLKSVTIPDSVTELDIYAFAYCPNLISVKMMEGLKSIGNFAFAGCSGLKNIAIPKSVTVMGHEVFEDCSSLESITVPGNVKSQFFWTFLRCTNLKHVTLEEGIMTIGISEFSGCSNLTEIDIPGTLTSIDEGAFSYCEKLKSITLPDNLVSIGKNAFDSCKSLTTVVIPRQISDIKDQAFIRCSSLESVTIPEGVTRIGECAFNTCNKLSSVTIPASVTKIGEAAFAGITIKGYTGSYAETYAKKNKLTFVPLDAPAPEISIPKSLTLGVKETYALDAAGASFKSSNTAVAAVDKKGVITAKKAGTATITVSAKGQKAKKCKVTVVKAPTEVSFAEKAVTLGVKETLALRPTITKGSHTSYTWSVKDKKIATVDKDGVVTGKKAGKTTVTVKTHNGKKATVTVTVQKAPTKVSLPKKAVTLGVKEALTLTPKIAKGAHTSFTWTVKDSKIATVTKNGKVTGKKAGKTTVTVKTHNGKKATVTVTVMKAPTAVSLEAKTMALGVKESVKLKPGIARDAHTSYTWTVKNKKIATVTKDGKLTGKKAGKTTVTVKTHNGKKATVTVTVQKAPTKVSLPKKAVTLGVKEALTLTPKIAKGAHTSFTWTVKDSKIATVTKNGKVTGKKAGKTTVTVKTHNGKKATMTVNVMAAPGSITLSGKSRELTVGDAIMLMPTLPKKTASRIKWTSSNKSVATVDASGVVRALKKGTAKITAKTFNGKKAVCTVTVGTWPSSVTFDVEAVSIGVKEQLKLKPIVNEGAKTTYTWSVKNNKIAKVSKKGVVTGVKAGTTTVTVKTQNDLTATVKVTVAAAPKKITLNKKKATLPVNQTLQLKATLPKKTASQIKWTTSKKKVATVDETGLVTAVAPGKATITAKTANGKKANCVVTVREETIKDHFQMFTDADEAAKDIDVDYSKLTMEQMPVNALGDSSDRIEFVEKQNALTAEINSDATAYFDALDQLAKILGEMDDVAGKTTFTYSDEGISVESDVISFNIITDASKFANNNVGAKKIVFNGKEAQIVVNDAGTDDIEAVLDKVSQVSSWIDRFDKFLDKLNPWLDKIDNICIKGEEDSQKKVDDIKIDKEALENDQQYKKRTKKLKALEDELNNKETPQSRKEALNKQIKKLKRQINRDHLIPIKNANTELVKASACLVSWKGTKALAKLFTNTCRGLIKKNGSAALAVSSDLLKTKDVVQVYLHKHPVSLREEDDAVKKKHVKLLNEAMLKSGVFILADVGVNVGLVLADLLLLAPSPAGFAKSFYVQFFGKHQAKVIIKNINKFINKFGKKHGKYTLAGIEVGVDIALTETTSHFVDKWVKKVKHEDDILHGKIRGTISGKVIDADTKKPIAGALVETDYKKINTKADGTFVLSAMYGDYKGKYAVKCTKENYEEGAGEAIVDEGASDAVVTIEMSVEGLPIDTAHFPDANFRNKVREFDLNGNESLSDEEIEKIKTVVVENCGIGSLEGIQYFTAMKKLSCRQNTLTSLDIMECAALRELDCSENALTVLKVAGHKMLETLYCFDNPLTMLDISWCTNLKTVYCNGSDGNTGKLKGLNASGCSALNLLDCSHNVLTLLDVGGCTALQTLDCSYNRLTSITTSGVSSGSVLSLNGCTGLRELRCNNNQLTGLSVKGCAGLQKLFCNSNRLTGLDVSGMAKLTNLNCGDNQLTSLNVTGCAALEVLNCAVNKLTGLDISACPSLQELYCTSNQIEVLNYLDIRRLKAAEYDDGTRVAILFGHYDQDANPSNGKEPIEWIVLEDKGDTLTLISRYGLDAKSYHNEWVDITWANCTLRSWLNGTFLNAAFTSAEQGKIQTVRVTAEDNPYWGTEAGSDTYDKVWLLSIREAENLFSSNAARICYPTAIAVAHGCLTSSSYGGSCWWWLRSPGDYSSGAADVRSDGYVFNLSSNYVHDDLEAVRPVVCLRLS